MKHVIDNIRRTTAARRPLAVTIVALLVGFAIIFAWRSWRQPDAEAATPPPTAAPMILVRTQTVPQSFEAVGTLEAMRQVTLAAEVPGRVVAIRFAAGDAVGGGRPLVQLYDAPERADLAAAVARARLAQAQYDRSLSLAPSGAEPVQALQQREAELAQARAAVRQIEARIVQKVVRAPFAGQIGLRKVNLGQYVNPGDSLATITDLSRLYVNFTVPQQQLQLLRVGAAVNLTTDAIPNRAFAARINAIEPLVGTDTRNVQVQAILDNPGCSLRPGLYVTARLALPDLVNAVVVPSTAIVTSASGDSILAVRRGVAVAVPVVTGGRIGDQVVVQQGLKAGDTIIVSGQLRVQPGAHVVAAR